MKENNQAAGQAGLATPREMAIAQAVRRACHECYSPDDTANDWSDKIGGIDLVTVIRGVSLAAPVAADTEQATELHELRRRASELEAARIAYANEFSLTDDGDADVGNIHANIRSLKAAFKAANDRLAELTATPADAGAGLADERLSLEKVLEIAAQHLVDDFHAQDALDFARAIEAEVLARPSVASELPKYAPEDYLKTPQALAEFLDDFASEGDASAATGAINIAVRALRSMVGSPAPVTAEPVVSINTPEFRMLTHTYLDAIFGGSTAEQKEAFAALVKHIDSTKLATPAPADRDAIRDQALEEAAKACSAFAYEQRDDERLDSALCCSDRIRALKSMERAASPTATEKCRACGGDGEHYQGPSRYTDCDDCNGTGVRAADAAETRDAEGGE